MPYIDLYSQLHTCTNKYDAHAELSKKLYNVTPRVLQGKALKSTAILRTVPCHTMRTYRTMSSGHVRQTLYSLPNASEHKQYYGRHRLPY